MPLRPTSVLLTCFRTRRRIGAYLDGALDEGARGVVTDHLTGCARCQGEADRLRRLHGLLRSALSTAPPADWTGFWEGVVRGVDAARLAPLPRATALRWWRRPRVAFGSALAAAIVLSVTFWQLSGPTAPQAAVVVKSADTEHPGGVMVYATPGQDMAVVWVFDQD